MSNYGGKGSFPIDVAHGNEAIWAALEEQGQQIAEIHDMLIGLGLNANQNQDTNVQCAVDFARGQHGVRQDQNFSQEDKRTNHHNPNAKINPTTAFLHNQKVCELKLFLFSFLSQKTLASTKKNFKRREDLDLPSSPFHDSSAWCLLCRLHRSSFLAGCFRSSL